ncbi:MAG: MFS transporter [Gammaproteobacteria bacterium]|nr:MFS transporter [Gammaproteobacteria bacterium]MCW8909945.1 MFS transporter [Gammaproteobacteria bacterium]MCW9056604.1 MFS transporter [Gammaproteobacteria bacterium]
MTTEPKTLHSWQEAVRVYTKPRILGMLFLGFSAGLPFLLVFSTLSAWLSDANVSRTTIGFFSWIGIMYSIKVLWAPVVDRLSLPVLTKLLGQRRSWLLLAQSGIASGLLLLAFTTPENSLQLFALYALMVAFSSATQDVVIDAYRIEAVDKEYQAAMAATYVLGYRVATLAAGAGALYMADFINWQAAYITMAVLTGIGIATTLIIREPEHRIKADTLAYEEQLINKIETKVHAKGFNQKITEWFTSAVISPFAEFFHRTGKYALLILLLIGTYRITDITMAVMANPFYLDLGFSKSEIASISKMFGFFLTIAGVALGGILVMRFGIMRILLLGGVLVIASNLLFAWLSQIGPEITMLAVVISADSLAGGIATAVFIAYLSSLTNTAYTATQYALFSSLMTLLPKLIAGFSGIIVDAYGYLVFYFYSSLLGLPALLIILYLLKNNDTDTP